MARDLLAYGQQTTTVYARRQCPCASLWRYASFCHDPFAHRLSCFPAQPFLAVNNTRNATGYKLQSKSTCFTAASLPFLFCQFIYMQEVAITSQTQAAFTPHQEKRFRRWKSFPHFVNQLSWLAFPCLHVIG